MRRQGLKRSLMKERRENEMTSNKNQLKDGKKKQTKENNQEQD